MSYSYTAYAIVTLVQMWCLETSRVGCPCASIFFSKFKELNGDSPPFVLDVRF